MLKTCDKNGDCNFTAEQRSILRTAVSSTVIELFRRMEFIYIYIYIIKINYRHKNSKTSWKKVSNKISQDFQLSCTTEYKDD